MTNEQLARFMSKVDQTDTCWLWTGSKARGYGKFKVESYRLVPAHRIAYEHFVGLIPDGHYAHHLCHVKACVNPKHLEIVPKRLHMGLHLRSHCPQGHPYDEINTYHHKGHRRCRACHREQVLAAAHARPEHTRAINKRAQARQRARRKGYIV